MLTSIPSLSIRKEIKSPSKSNILLNNQVVIKSNDKRIIKNDSLKKLNELNDYKNRNHMSNLNLINSISLNKNTNNIIDCINIKDFNSIGKSKNIKSISPNTSNMNSILNPRFITLVNNLQKNRNIKIKSPKSIKSITKLPKITKKVLLTEADTLVKQRKRHDGLLAPHIATNVSLKKSAQINLKNYVIRKIKEKREEIQNEENKITEEFKNKQKIYDKNYRNYLDSIEQNQKKQKEEEEQLNLLNLKIEEQENIISKEIINNKKLVDELKKIVNSVVSYTKYGSFIYKIFGRKFIYEELKEFDGKDYNKMMFRFIDVYDKTKEDINYKKEENEFLEMLHSHGVDFLTMQFADMETNLRKQLDSNNLINEELAYLNNNSKNEIELLLNNKKISENKKILFNDRKNKQEKIIKDFKEYDIEETKSYLKYIIELLEIMEGRTKKRIIKNIDVNEDTLLYCDKVLNTLEKKEILINKYMREIENIINNDKSDNSLIEKIINDRKKYNIKIKQIEQRKIQEDIDFKKKLKTIDEQRIVIKGTKVIKDFPLIKNIKKKKIFDIKKNQDDFEYLYYSSDEN